MNAANLFITLLLFLIYRYSLCSEIAEDKEYENFAQNYAKLIQKSWTPDMFAFREWISPGLMASPVKAKYVIDTEKYANGFYNIFLKDFTSQCTRDLWYTISNLKSQWAMKMIDSDGKLPSGVLSGNLKWPGDYTQCKDVYAPPDANSSMGNFHGRYCSATLALSLGSLSLPISPVGLCVPDSCDGQEIMSNIQNVLYILDRFPALNKISGIVNFTGITCKPLERKLDGPAIGMICFLSVLGFLIIVGSSVTIFEYFVPCTKEDLHPVKCLFVRNHTEDTISNDGSINHVQTIGEKVFIECEQGSSDNKQSLVFDSEQGSSVSAVIARYMRSFVKSFCIFTNGAKILNTDVGEGQLLCIHGIRFLSMAWVILGHTYIFAMTNSIANVAEVISVLKTWTFQVLLQGTLSVDSFFVLSGFLLTYLFLKEADKKEGKISWPLFYFHRLWRLTPVYMVTLGFDAALAKYLASGPFWSEDSFDPNCKKSWWRNLIYINNFGDANEQCFSWGWYLANDMQFYIISPIFLYTLWRWPKAGLSIVFTLLLSSWIAGGVITVKYNLYAGFGGIPTDISADVLTRFMDYFWKYYVKPYTRIGPYLIGVLVGYLLYMTGNKKKFLEPWSQLLGWSFATAFSLCVIFGTYDSKLSMSTTAAYNALSRSAFSLSLAWVIYACQTGHGDIVNKILSWKMFIPLSRLTYCAYLVHPIVIIGFYQSLLQPFFFSHILMVILFLGFLVMTYMMALITSLAMESPMMGIEKLLLKKN